MPSQLVIKHALQLASVLKIYTNSADACVLLLCSCNINVYGVMRNSLMGACLQ